MNAQEMPKRSVWESRSCLYKLGVFCLVVASLAYALGHVAPYWIRQKGVALDIPSEDYGIWFFCTENSSCSTWISDEDHLKATRTLEILGFVGLVSSIGIALFFNCRRNESGSIILLEIVIVLSAMLGFSGAMVFLGNTRSTVQSFENLSYNWAFAINVAGSILALLAGIMIFFANRFAECNGRSSKPTGSFIQPDYKPEYRDNGRSPQLPEHRDGWGSTPAPGPYSIPAQRPYPIHPPDHLVYASGDPGGLYRLPHRGDRKSDDDNPISDDHVTDDYFYPASDRYYQGSRIVDTPERIQHGQHSWHTGMEMSVVPVKGQLIYPEGGPVGYVPDGRDLSAAHRLYPTSAPYPPVVEPMGPFTLPRVVLRGYYEPAYGYPDYVLM